MRTLAILMAAGAASCAGPETVHEQPRPVELASSARPALAPRLERLLAEMADQCTKADAGVEAQIDRLIELLESGTLDERGQAGKALVTFAGAAVLPVARACGDARSPDHQARLHRVLEDLWERLGPSYVVWTGRHAVDAGTGRVLWSVNAMPVQSFARGREVVFVDGGQAWSRDLRTGRIVGELSPLEAQPPAEGGEIAVASGRILLVQENITTRAQCVGEGGVVLWTVAGSAEHTTSLRGVADGGSVYLCAWIDMCCQAPQVTRVNVENGEVLWSAAASNKPVGHSKYWHDARVCVRGNLVIVSGLSGGAAYVESFRVEDGSRVSRWDER